MGIHTTKPNGAVSRTSNLATHLTAHTLVRCTSIRDSSRFRRKAVTNMEWKRINPVETATQRITRIKCH